MERIPINFKKYLPQKIGAAYKWRMIFYILGIAFCIYMMQYLSSKSNQSKKVVLPKEINNIQIEKWKYLASYSF